MFCRTVLMAMLGVTLIASGCATPATYNPFKLTQEEIYARTKTIGLAPVTVPSGLEDPGQVRDNFEAVIEGKLREAGFVVIPSKECDAIWKQMVEQVGGYFDPVSGKRDETKFKTVREHTIRELNAKYNVDALLFPTIWVVTVNWSGTTVSWHGTSEPITSTGQQVLQLFTGVSGHGTVPALSLHIHLQDINGSDLYKNNGGIQLLSKLSGSKFVAVPQQELFANRERNKQAVNIALDPLIKKPEPSETVKGEPKKQP